MIDSKTFGKLEEVNLTLYFITNQIEPWRLGRIQEDRETQCVVKPCPGSNPIPCPQEPSNRPLDQAGQELNLRPYTQRPSNKPLDRAGGESYPKSLTQTAGNKPLDQAGRGSNQEPIPLETTNKPRDQAGRGLNPGPIAQRPGNKSLNQASHESNTEPILRKTNNKPLGNKPLALAGSGSNPETPPQRASNRPPNKAGKRPKDQVNSRCNVSDLGRYKQAEIIMAVLESSDTAQHDQHPSSTESRKKKPGKMTRLRNWFSK